VHVGVPLGKASSMDAIMVFSHEILGPWHYPRTIVQPLGEAISMWHSEQAAIALSGALAARGRELQQMHLSNFWAGDPTGLRYDVAKDFNSDMPTGFGKAHFIYDTLRSQLGEEFFRNY